MPEYLHPGVYIEETSYRGKPIQGVWRSVKYEEVYLRAYAAVSEARSSIARYLSFYNGRRPHSTLAAKTPNQTYFDNLPVMMAA